RLPFWLSLTVGSLATQQQLIVFVVFMAFFAVRFML
ncbi:MAG: hypothetical protein ACI8PD_002037, partial [Nitrospinales bacterium]